MWESRLSGSVRGRRTTEVWKRSCGTAAKAGGNRENKQLPVAPGDSCLLERAKCLLGKSNPVKGAGQPRRRSPGTGKECSILTRERK